VVKEYLRYDPMGDKHTYGREFMRVSSHDCFICSKRGWWAHHVKTVGSGGRDAFNLVPLCQHHHEEIEQVGPKTFEFMYDCSLENIALHYGLTSPFLGLEG